MNNYIVNYHWIDKYNGDSDIQHANVSYQKFKSFIDENDRRISKATREVLKKIYQPERSDSIGFYGAAAAFINAMGAPRKYKIVSIEKVTKAGELNEILAL